MRLRLLALGAAVLLLAGLTIQHWNASAAQPQTDAANAAVQYIEGLQNADGGFPSSGTASAPGATLDVAFALKAAGVAPASVTRPGGASLRDYMLAQTPPAGDPGALAKLSLGLTISGLDGRALVGDMGQYINHQTDGYGDNVFQEAFYVFALVAADAPHPASAAYLRSIQRPDGGWEFAASYGSDSNTTAMALQALLAAGGSATEQATANALAYLATTQHDSGGFGFTATDDPDPNSTALVIQALVAAGQKIDAGGPWDRNGHTPLDGLLSFRNAATGAFQYGGADNPFATYQAVPALMLAPFPQLETRIVLAATPTPTTAATASPLATAVATALPSATPVPHVVLPGAGSRGESGDVWWPIAAAAAGAMAIGAGALARRRR